MKYNYRTFLEGKARMESRFIEKEYLSALWLIIPSCTFLMITKAWACSPVILFFWFVDSRMKTKAKHTETLKSLLKFHPDIAYVYYAQNGLIPRVHYKQLMEEYENMKEFLEGAPISWQEKEEIIKPYQDHMLIMRSLMNSCLEGLYPEWVPIKEEEWNNRTMIATKKGE